jgi:undecaprenyl-diphosphatase
MLAGVDGVVGVLERLPPLVVLALAVLLVMGETGVLIGLFFPVEITLLFVGFLTYVGEVPFVPAFLLMIGAAVAGDALALRSGRKYGPRVRASRFGARIGKERWAKADRILHRLGGRSAFIARWVPFVRTLLPRLAGSAGMPYRRFVGWNVAGVVTAVGGSVVLGYLAGASYRRAAERFGSATTAVLLLLAAVVVIVLVGRWLGRHPYPVRALAGRAAALPPLRWHGRWVRAASARVGGGWAFALDLAAGLAVLVALALGLSWLVRLIVDHSGLSGVDGAVARWFAGHRTEEAVAAAEVAATLLGGWVLIGAVAVAGLVRAVRDRVRRRLRAEPASLRRRLRAEPASLRRRLRAEPESLWHGDLIGLVGTVGAAVPLVILAAVAGLAATVAVAGLGTLAWLLTRGARWPHAVAGWTLVAVAVVIVLNARLYLGWDTASEAATAVLLGGLWTAVYLVAWATRDRAAGRREPDSLLSQQPH